MILLCFVRDLWCCTQILSATLAFVLPLRPHPLRGVFMVHTQEGCIFYVSTKLEADSSIHSKVIRVVPKFGNLVTWPTYRLIVHTQEGSVLNLYTKFEADCAIHSKVIKGFQNLEIRSRDPGHAHYGPFYNPYAWRVGPLCLHQTWSG